VTTDDREIFKEQIRQIERAHKRGKGFVAPGTVRHLDRPTGDGHAFGWGMVGVLTILSVFVIKGMLYAQAGPAEYTARLDHLATGGWLEQAGAVLFYPDPLTRVIASALRSTTNAPLSDN
jgi:hypothetical protein